MSEKIQFQTNLPVEVALQYLEGKPVDSQFGGVQHLFSTTDNRVFFVSEMVGNIIADQLKKLGVQKGEAIEICKAEVTQGRGRKGIQWVVKRIPTRRTARRNIRCAGGARSAGERPGAPATAVHRHRS
jgi:small basic protein